MPDVWGNDYFDDTYWVNGVKKKFEGYCTDIWFGEALKFIESKKDGEQPFLAYVSTNAPHSPFLVADKYKEIYAGNPAVPNVPFYGMITNIDDNMGTLMAKLDEWGISENTILIFMTDNGTAAGYSEGKKNGAKGFNDGMRGKKGSEYEGGHRVPLFIRWPDGNITAGRDIPNLTAHIDVLPTLMEYCGIKDRPDGAPMMQGKSLVPLISGDAQGWAPRTLVTDSQRIENPEMWRKSAVMTDRWRLINGEELYDMSADPGQTKDVAGANVKVVEKLRAEYESWWSSVSTRFGETCDIVVGDERDHPTRLTSHDWHGKVVPWNQAMVKKGVAGNGSWAIDVAKAGKYEISLTRWPIELNAPINGDGGIEGGKALVVKKARLLAGAGEVSKDIAAGDVAVKFEVELTEGKQRLQTWFVNEGGEGVVERGAYFVYLRKL